MFFFDNAVNNFTFKPRSVEYAYLAILNDDLDTAKLVFESIDSSRAKWGKALTGILSGFTEKFPTYFEIRNFFEIDLDFLIKNDKTHYVEMLLSSLKYLSQINQEIYKYTARVMLENKLNNSALEYMEKSKELFYSDPELHFMLAKFYLSQNNFNLAIVHIDECLKIVPSYYPAIKIRKEISSRL